ncbi:alpha/beta fold hydrolase [bacterium]|nr:alpha/beta fold hydrolase [bacterium]
MFKLIFCLIFLFSLQLFAFQEDKALSQVVSLLDSGNGSFYQLGFFETQLGLSEKSIEQGKTLKISYVKFGKTKGSKGSLVIVPGRTEAGLKYIEVAADLIQKGYSPIYSIDHRGQGFTPTVTAKKLPDSQIGHIENFDHYVKDFSQFVRFVVLKDPQIDQKNLFLLSNSMGGTIALRYFQQNPVNPFKKSALSASMFKIITNDPLALIKTTAVCGVGKIGKLDCYGYTPGESALTWAGQEVLPDGRAIDVREFHGDDPTNPRNLTSSKDRFHITDYLWNKWPQSIVAGPTIKWTEQSLLASKVLRQNDELKKVNNDVFILIASRDFRADGPAQERVCRTLKNCRMKTYDSYHEILMETDSIRNQAMKDILSYFGK